MAIPANQATFAATPEQIKANKEAYQAAHPQAAVPQKTPDEVFNENQAKFDAMNPA